MTRLAKRIRIVVMSTTRVIDIKRIESRDFRSYRAVAKYLEPGERVTVAVYEKISGSDLEVFSGYGEVERTREGWIEPRRLAHDF